jgi:hypothetical protein
LAVPAYAGVSQDFSECDGLKKPKSSDDGMRGQATFPAYTFGFGNDGPSRTLAACNRALESDKLLPEQTLRKAHLMRARAAAKLELGDTAGALADLDSAEAAGKAYAGDFSYQRSMGVSINLLRAIALGEKGDKAASLTLAEAAAMKRPYAVQVQLAATMLRSRNGDDATKKDVWRELLQIDPAARDLYQQMAMKPDDFAAMAAHAGAPVVPLPIIEGNFLTMGDNSLAKASSELSATVNRAMNTAYALAANGKPDAAREWIAATRKAFEPASADEDAAGEKKEDKKPTGLGPLVLPMIRAGNFEPMVAVTEARIAIAEGRLSDAFALMNNLQLRSTPVTDKLYAAYATARSTSATSARELPALAPATPRGQARLVSLASNLLIPPESKLKQINYEKSRPNVAGALLGAAFSMGTSLLGGIERTAGFRSSPNTDGSTKVEYTGNTTSGPVVQEMTLLRAAELTREAGKSRFYIVLRNDYERYLTQMMYGTPTERTLTGYKTELSIRFLGDDESEENALDAATIIEALGPVYYDSAKQKVAAKKSS